MPGAGAARQRSCVVAGAGVLGVCLAARLAETGAEVTLLDQDQPGQAATRSSFAWLNSNDKAPRAYHDLNHAGVRAWEQLAGSLGDVAWYRPAGNFEWAASEPGRAELAARVSRLTEWGYPARLISAAEAAELEPSLRLPGPAPEVAWFPGEGYLLTEAMISDLLARAVGHGATVLTGERGRVTGFEAGPEADGCRLAVRLGGVCGPQPARRFARTWWCAVRAHRFPGWRRWPVRPARSRCSPGWSRVPPHPGWWCRPAR